MESWYFGKIHFLSLWDFQQTTNPLKVPIPTAAPDRGGPIARLSGPVPKKSVLQNANMTTFENHQVL